MRHAGAVIVYTDGACSGNPGPGGWAWAVAPDGEPRGTGGDRHTTNQRMEIHGGAGGGAAPRRARCT